MVMEKRKRWILLSGLTLMAGALLLWITMEVQRRELEQARVFLETTAVLVSTERPHRFLDNPGPYRLKDSDRIKTALLDEKLNLLHGELDIRSSEFRQDAALALKTGVLVSGKRAAYVLIPLGQRLLVLAGTVRSLGEILLSMWPLIILLAALLSGTLILSRRTDLLSGRPGKDCRIFLEELTGDTGDCTEMESLLERARRRWRELEQGMQAAQKEIEYYRKETESLKRALRKTSQDLKAIRDDLIQAGTLTALGEFAAGMSHELNNPLGIVLGFTQHLLDEFPPDHPHYSKLKRMETELGRCQKIIQDLLSFARPANPAIRDVDMNTLIRETVQFALYTRPEGMEITQNLDKDLPRIQADPDQLEQVLLNLLKNAVEAMPQGGKLEISSSSVQLSSEDCLQLSIPLEQPGSLLLEGAGSGKSMRTPKLAPVFKAGSPAVLVEIKDSGEGMEQEILQKIFTPFFTTKKRHGTGLGLSICWKLVRKNGGIMRVKSEKGRGTVFSLLFPVREDE